MNKKQRRKVVTSV